jgi:hypothetical protein
MSTSLQAMLSQVSEEFAQRVFEVIRTAFIDELSNVNLSGGAAPAPRARAAAPKSEAAVKAPKGKLAPKAAPKAAPKPVRLERRSSESIAKALEGIAALLSEQPGIGSEQIQKTLGFARNEIARPIAIGIANGVLRKTGAKRATKYFVGNGAKKPAKAAKAAKAVKPTKATKATKATKPAKKPAKKPEPAAEPAAEAT